MARCSSFVWRCLALGPQLVHFSLSFAAQSGQPAAKKRKLGSAKGSAKGKPAKPAKAAPKTKLSGSDSVARQLAKLKQRSSSATQKSAIQLKENLETLTAKGKHTIAAQELIEKTAARAAAKLNKGKPAKKKEQADDDLHDDFDDVDLSDLED
jgi:hypothetical protein